MPPAYATALGVKTTPTECRWRLHGQRVGAWVIDFIIQMIITTVASWFWLSQFITWYSNWFTQILNETAAGGSATFDQTILGRDQRLHPADLVGQLRGDDHLPGRVPDLEGCDPGKLALGIAVRLRERPGNPTLVVALKRQLIYIGTSLLSLVPGIGAASVIIKLLNLLWPLWDDKRQALHDKVAATNVVVRRRER